MLALTSGRPAASMAYSVRSHGRVFAIPCKRGVQFGLAHADLLVRQAAEEVVNPVGQQQVPVQQVGRVFGSGVGGAGQLSLRLTPNLAPGEPGPDHQDAEGHQNRRGQAGTGKRAS